MEYNFFDSSTPTSTDLIVQLLIIKQVAEFIFFVTAPLFLLLISLKLSKIIHKLNEIIYKPINNNSEQKS